MGNSYANAVLITVDDDVAGLTNIIFGQNDHIDRSLDINIALSLSVYNKPYSINSAFIDLKFEYDATDPTVLNKTFTGQQMWNANAWNREGERARYFNAWDTLLMVICIN